MMAAASRIQSNQGFDEGRQFATLLLSLTFALLPSRTKATPCIFFIFKAMIPEESEQPCNCY
jgi:hypothetical protein